MRKMRSFLGCLASLFLLVFSANALAEGYTCPANKEYTSCNKNYYLNQSGAGNACLQCSTAQNHTTTETCQIDCSSQKASLHAKTASATSGTKTCNGNYTEGNGGTEVGAAKACSGCSSWGECQNAGQCYATSCETGYYYSTSGGHGTCTACTSVTNHTQLKSDTIRNGTRVQTCTGTYTTGAGDTNGSNSCSGCSASKYECQCNSGYHSSGSGESCTCEIDTIDCSKGQYYYGSTRSCTPCLNGYYCTGGRYTDNGQTQGLVQCPQDATGSSGLRNGIGTCYKKCEDKSVPNAKSVTATGTGNVSPKSSTEWYECKYDVTCNEGYKPSGSGTANPSCSQCSANKYCDGNSETGCPQDYPTSSAGSSAQTQCYRSCTKDDVQNSETVSGTVKYPGTDKSQCTVSQCASGYFITDNNKKTCTKCPENSNDCTGTDVGPENWNCNEGYTKRGNECVADGNTWQVTYNYNCNSTYTESCSPVYFGPESDNVQITCRPTCQGYTFQGWYTLVTGGRNVTCVTGKTSSNYSCYSWQSNLTVYAHWTADTLSCSAGQYYNHTTKKCTQCPANSYCPGTNYTLDDTTDKGLNNCPSGYTKSDVGNSSEDNCYRDCTTSDVNGSTAVSGTLTKGGTNTCTPTQCDSSHYKNNNQCKTCPQNAKDCGGGGDTWTCNDGYNKQGDSCVADGSKWHVEYNYNCDYSYTQCSDTVYFGPETTKAEITCTPTCTNQVFTGWFTTVYGDTKVTCVTGKVSGGDPTCEVSQSDLTVYAHWTPATETCQSGKYYDGSTHKDCNQKGTDYYCPGTGSVTVGQAGCFEQCPANFRDGVDSPYSANTNCYHTCEQKTDNNAKNVTAQQTKINYPGNDMSPNCTYTVDCNAGYKPSQQGTENASCVQCTGTEYCPGGSGNPEECPAGYTCSGGEKQPCTDGHYCSGGTSHDCPDGYPHSPANASEQTQCYKNCDKKIENGTVTATADKANAPNGTCSYSVSCQPGYKPSGQGTENATCEQCSNGELCKGGTSEPETCPENSYCDKGIQHQCPQNGSADAGATDSSQCYLDNHACTVPNGNGVNKCYYSSSTQTYSAECTQCQVNNCDEGYSLVGNTCKTCPENHVCKDGEQKTCGELTGNEYTLSDQRVEHEQSCYRSCSLENFPGKYPHAKRLSGRDYYQLEDTCAIALCEAGYHLQHGECVECPEGSICDGTTEPGEGGSGDVKTCASMTNNQFTLSDKNATSVNDCYRECPLAEHAANMTGRDYYGTNPADTCKVTKCAKGYTLENGMCKPCPAGSFCDGTTDPGDGGDGKDVQSCDTLGNAYDNPESKWKYADPGADDKTDCYAKCENYDVEYGTAIADSPKVYYPNKCTYHGESETGNPCDLVGDGENAKCVENSCKGNFEMVDGKCQLCNREHALSYRAEGNCLIASCVAGYHSTGTSCEQDVRVCEAPDATYAEQTWDKKARTFTKCTIKECNEGYHLASNACVPNQQACNIDHGRGYQEWDSTRNTWGDCIATHCDAGYTSDPKLTYEPNKQCGQCKNKFAQLGERAVEGYNGNEQAASSYTNECEIAACMYQGELYDLQNNECVPICTPYTDETGTRKRVGNKCVRTCNDGYMSW